MKTAQDLAKERLASMFGELVEKYTTKSEPVEQKEADGLTQTLKSGIPKGKFDTSTPEGKKAYQHAYYLLHKAEMNARTMANRNKNIDVYRSNALKWYHANKEHCLEYNRKWKAEHREECNKRMREWREKNKEQQNAYHREWRKKKKEQKNEQIPPAP